MSVPDIQNALELLRQRDVDAAISSLKEKVEEIPAHLTAHVLLARAYEAKRDWSMALRSWENAHFLMPNSPIVTAGKERVLERINEEEDAAPAPSDPSPQPPASRGDASPSTEPPEPQAPASPEREASKRETSKRESAKSESTATSDTAPSKEIQTPPVSTAQPEPPAQPEPDESQEPEATEQNDAQPQVTNETQEEAQSDTSSTPNRIAQQAQALLHGTKTSTSDADQVESNEQAEARQEASQSEAPQEQTSADSATPQSTASADAASEEPTTTDSTAKDTAPPEHLQRIVGQFADAEDDDSSAEIETSRRPDTTSYRPDTAIIDAAASLLNRGPTPASKESGSDADKQRTEPGEPNAPTSQAQGEAQEQDVREQESRDEPTESSSGNLTPEDEASAAPDAGLPDAATADAFIPDFAARSTSSETDEPAQSEPTQSDSAQPSAPDDAPTAETRSQESEEDIDADAKHSQQASYDTYDMPESRLLDELGPPPDARPLRDEELEEDDTPESATAQGSTAEREDTSAEKAPSVRPPSPDTSFSQPPLTDKLFESKTPSGQQRSSEASAKGNRPRMNIPNPADLLPSDIPHRQSNEPHARESTDADAGSSQEGSEGTAATGDGTDGLSELEKLRRSAEQEARQGGARPGLRQQLQQQSSQEQSSGKTDDTIGDLDQLIQDLESARIQPRPDLDELPTPNLEDDVEDLVSETLARIYAAQSQYREAARIYVKLASQEPANARDHLENAADMRKKAEKKEAEERAAEASGNE